MFFVARVVTSNFRLCFCLSSPVYDKQGFLLQLDTKLWVHLLLVNLSAI